MSISVASLDLALRQLRQRRPLVHAISNLVSLTPVANALLALGATPVMAHAEVEVAEITGAADALLLNLGTLEPAREAAMQRALARAAARAIPVVLDPVGVGASEYRRAVALALLQQAPVTLIRGNASEIRALAGETATARGVDSLEASTAALAAARELAARHARVVVVSGTRDLLIHREAELAVANGHPLMARVTAMGCIASALCAAFAAVDPQPLRAAAHAMACMGLAGELAMQEAVGPGSLAVGFVDALYALEGPRLAGLRAAPLG